MEEVLLEQVVKKLKGLSQKRWLVKKDGGITYYSTYTSNFGIVITKHDSKYLLYDLKIAQKEDKYSSSSISFYPQDNSNTKKLLADLLHHLELNESSEKNYRELLLEGLLEELK